MKQITNDSLNNGQKNIQFFTVKKFARGVVFSKTDRPDNNLTSL